MSRGAVCTSGDYARYIEIEGQRYSEILDPRTGRPVDLVSSVTVVAEDAMTADGWATALTVLGSEGLRRLPRGEGIEALVVGVDESGAHIAEASAGFADLLASFELDLTARQ